MEEDLKIRQTMQERFEGEFKDLKGGYTFASFKHFMESEMESFAREILGKEYSYVSGVTHLEDNHVVSVGDILAAARERGIELID